MASEAEVPELSTLFERLFSRRRDISLFIPFILGFAGAVDTTTTFTRESPIQDPDRETAQRTNPNDRIILINPFNQGMMVIEGRVGSLDSVLRELAVRSGQPPASKASIEAMPSVVIGEIEAKDGGECVICLEEWEIGGLVKEMPCKHRFHGNCIEKWLGIHGSCPVCRHKMPVDEEELGKKIDEEGEGGERRVGREIWVSFSIGGNRSNGDSIQTPSNSSEAPSSAPESHPEMEG